jgi:hypothetical protein
MKRSASFGAIIVAVCATVVAPAIATPAAAGGWHRYGYDAPRTYKRSYRSRAYDSGVRYYNSPRAYRAACGYGDCACLRNIALSTGNPVWWDKYQACAG